MRVLETGHPLLDRLLTLWRGKKCGPLLPARRDLDVLELRHWLGHLALVEVAEADFRFRLYGTALGALLGQDLTGRTLGTVTNGLRESLIEDYGRVCRERAPWVRTRHYAARPCPVALRELILPLAGNGERVDMLLVAGYPVTPAASVVIPPPCRAGGRRN